MAYFAYLRVSTSQQDTENQKLSVLEYCNRQNLVPVQCIEDTRSGKVPWQQRPIGPLLESAQEDDHLIVAEVSRLGRSTLQVLEILEQAAQKKVSIRIAKSNMVMNGLMQSTIAATILGRRPILNGNLSLRIPKKRWPIVKPKAFPWGA